jgi:hypothetical protein
MQDLVNIILLTRHVYCNEKASVLNLRKPSSIHTKFELDTGQCVFIDNAGYCDIWSTDGTRETVPGIYQMLLGLAVK